LCPGNVADARPEGRQKRSEQKLKPHADEGRWQNLPGKE
jgi:hypothetical protein